MNWTTRLENVDRRLIYVLLLLFCVLPLLRPIGIPLMVTTFTREVYEMVEGLNPATDKVLLVCDISPGMGLDAYVVPAAVTKHLIQRGIPWVGVSFVPDGPMMLDKIAASANVEAKGLQYGVDYANLGYMAGTETAVRFFALDCLAIPTDTRGNATADLPIMQGIESVSDFSLTIQYYGAGPETWVRQVVDPMGIDFVFVTNTVSVPGSVPYYEAGQLKGLLGGLRSAAEYEKVTDLAGQGASMMDAQSMAHLLILAFIALGNLGYLYGRRVAARPKTSD